jgi:hypothetical protein
MQVRLQRLLGLGVPGERRGNIDAPTVDAQWTEADKITAQDQFERLIIMEYSCFKIQLGIETLEHCFQTGPLSCR